MQRAGSFGVGVVAAEAGRQRPTSTICSQGLVGLLPSVARLVSDPRAPPTLPRRTSFPGLSPWGGATSSTTKPLPSIDDDPPRDDSRCGRPCSKHHVRTRWTCRRQIEAPSIAHVLPHSANSHAQSLRDTSGNESEDDVMSNAGKHARRSTNAAQRAMIEKGTCRFSNGSASTSAMPYAGTVSRALPQRFDHQLWLSLLDTQHE